MTNLLTPATGSIGYIAKHGSEYLDGTRTVKDDMKKSVEGGKNAGKFIGKRVLTTAATSAATCAGIYRMFDGKFPQFVEKAISKIKDVPFVKYMAEEIADTAPVLLNFAASQAKKHPLVFAGLTAVSIASSLLFAKHTYDLGKDNGQVQQKYDDIVEIRKNQLEGNPLVKDI